MQRPFARCGVLFPHPAQVISAIFVISRPGDFIRVGSATSPDLFKFHLKPRIAQVDEIIVEAFEASFARSVSRIFDDELLHEERHQAVDIIRVDTESHDDTSQHEGAKIFRVGGFRSVVSVDVNLLEVF